MNRRIALRKCLTGAASVLFTPVLLRAEQQCAPLMPNVSRCTAGISSANLERVQAFQQMPEWCWAASIQMMFSYWGHSVNQQRIVKETWGSIVNMPGQPSQIMSDLNREWTDDDGNSFRSIADMASVNAATAVLDLQQNRPLIIGALGHAMVLTALTSDINNMTTAFQVVLATVRDPWPANGGRRNLSAMEWNNISFAARVLVEGGDD